MPRPVRQSQGASFKKGFRPLKGQNQRRESQNMRQQMAEEHDNESDQDDQYNIDGTKIANEIKLTEKELNEDMPSKMLQPNNPRAPKNTTYYDYFSRKFVTNELVDQLIKIFSLNGDVISIESQEYKIQEQIEDMRKESLEREKQKLKQEEETKLEQITDKAIKETMRNKFEYNTRECQTITPIIREKGQTTKPPKSNDISGKVTQWEIFDEYMLILREKNKEQNKKEEKVDKSDKPVAKSMHGSDNSNLLRCFKLMERMVVQNDQDEKYNDYRYYLTANDNLEVGKNDGIIYPIWRFSSEKTRKKNVTSICWNPKYSDLFAISLGSYDFAKQGKPGHICLYSLKNTTHPEYSFQCESGVMSLDFHPTSPSLLAVGLYDGSVLVYDIRNKHKKPIYQSTVRNKKHTDPVWQVKWNPDTSKHYNFYSISSDGRVMNWILMKNKLEPEEVILLRLVGKNDEESTLIGLACGLTFDFNKFEPHIFLVGTEEGKIHKCSRAYSGQYQDTYSGHLLAVYKVRWNNFHKRVFISASADWTIRLWDTKYRKNSIMQFQQSVPCVDALWANYSSTVFAAATLDRVLIYDLSVDKHNKLADAKATSKSRLTNLCFNQKDPILLVGDTHGGVLLFKLSPNLTRSGLQVKDYPDEKKIPENLKKMTLEQFEFWKMDQLLMIVDKWERDENEE